MPEPARLPLYQPSSIGPPESAIAGMFTVAAAISAGRRGLVAAGGEHDAVERIAVKHLDQPEISEVAVERGGRALAGFLEGMRGKFEGDAAGGLDAFAHALGELRDGAGCRATRSEPLCAMPMIGLAAVSSSRVRP